MGYGFSNVRPFLKKVGHCLKNIGYCFYDIPATKKTAQQRNSKTHYNAINRTLCFLYKKKKRNTFVTLIKIIRILQPISQRVYTKTSDLPPRESHNNATLTQDYIPGKRRITGGKILIN